VYIRNRSSELLLIAVTSKFIKRRATWCNTVTSFSFLVCFFGLLLGSSLESFGREIVTPTETGKPTSFVGISPLRIQIVLGKHHNFLASNGRLRFGNVCFTIVPGIAKITYLFLFIYLFIFFYMPEAYTGKGSQTVKSNTSI